MKQFWSNLSHREQWLIGVCLSLIGLCLLYFLIFTPLNQHVKQMKQQVQTQQQLLMNLQTAKQQINDLGIGTKQVDAKKISADNLLNIVYAGLQDNQIKSYASLIKPIDNKAVFVEFKSVPFDLLLQCLNNLWQTYEIKTIKLNAAPLQTRGLVNSSIVIGFIR